MKDDMKSHSEAGCFTELFLTRVSNIRNEFKLKFTGEWNILMSVTSHAHPDTLNNLENCCKEKEQILKHALNKISLTSDIY